MPSGRAPASGLPLADIAEHHAARAWDALQGSRAPVTGIECLTYEPHCRVYRLAINGSRRPHSVVAKWKDRPFSFERKVQQEILPAVGLPSLEVYGELADAHDDSFWIFFEDAGDEDVFASDENASLVACWLAALHQWTGAASEVHTLADRGPAGYLGQLRAARQRISDLEQPWLRAANRTLLLEIVRHLDRLEQRWDRVESLCALAPTTLVHGDLAGKNARLREAAPASELLVFDWEMAGFGVPCVDLAQATLGSLSPNLSVYYAEVRKAWPHVSLVSVERLAAIGRVFRLLAELDWETEQWYVADIYPSVLADAIGAANLDE